MRNLHFNFLILFLFLAACKTETPETQSTVNTPNPFVWEAANVYFLMTDRFKNGDTSNDLNFSRDKKTGKLRGFEGGDIKGIIEKVEDGYFNDLGINVLWFTPVVEQIHGSVDEGTGATYGYHGYWAKDWTNLDPNFGSMADLEGLVATAHKHGIRIMMDVVLNHTGPVTDEDLFWGEDWARQDPPCTYTNYASTVDCTLVKNLPDIKTDSEQEVALPGFLMAKWKQEGRYEQEMRELDDFFAKAKLPKTPHNYLIKWLTDYVRELGIDAFRVDTVKHVKEAAWEELKKQASLALTSWKQKNDSEKLDDTDFFMVGEVYNYSIDAGREFDFGDQKADYFAHGFDDLINFQWKYDATGDMELLFAKYDSILHTSLKGKSVMNYATSHDDGQPFDKDRSKTFEAATKLLLTPGISQIYYGDETARNLTIAGTEGDAMLRSPMNWAAMDSTATKELLAHWQKLGRFRRDHPAVGAGRHEQISSEHYVFMRRYTDNGVKDTVVVSLGLPKGKKTVSIGGFFEERVTLRDAYSGDQIVVKNKAVKLDTPFDIVLLERVE